MSKVLDILVVYQEDGLMSELVVEVPAGLSNTEFVNFVHASIGESANIHNIINIGIVNSQKSVAGADSAAPAARPMRRSDARPTFGTPRPYGTTRAGGRAEKPSGGYAGRSPRDGAKPGRGGVFNERPGK
jgi:hypothetical protein